MSNKIHVRDQAELLSMDVSGMASLLKDLNVDVDYTGFFSPEKFVSALKRAVVLLFPDNCDTDYATRSAMGRDRLGCRRWAAELLGSSGAPVLEKTGHGGTRFVVETQNDTIQVKVYVSTRRAEEGIASFCVKMEDEVSWFMFVVRQWGKAYLYSRESLSMALTERGRKSFEKSGSVFFRVRQTDTDNLFHNQIEKLKEGNNVKGKI